MDLGFLPDIMNSFVIFLESYYSIFILCMCMCMGGACECRFPGGQKRVSEPLELEGDSEPVDMGAGNQTEIFHKSSTHT